MTTTNSKFIAQQTTAAVKRAQAVLGVGWDHVSPTIRNALAKAEAVTWFRGQDDSISAEKTVANMNAIVDAIDAMLPL